MTVCEKKNSFAKPQKFLQFFMPIKIMKYFSISISIEKKTSFPGSNYKLWIFSCLPIFRAKNFRDLICNSNLIRWIKTDRYIVFENIYCFLWLDWPLFHFFCGRQFFKFTALTGNWSWTFTKLIHHWWFELKKFDAVSISVAWLKTLSSLL